MDRNRRRTPRPRNRPRSWRPTPRPPRPPARRPRSSRGRRARRPACARPSRARGGPRGGGAPEPTATATTVRVRDGQTLTTDGPFAETKEQVGGYFLVECENLDGAIEAAAKLPGAQTGSIEVRPIWEM